LPKIVGRRIEERKKDEAKRTILNSYTEPDLKLLLFMRPLPDKFNGAFENLRRLYLVERGGGLATS
jgi:hypothetical protein